MINSLQELYNKYESQDYNKSWHASISKYVEALQKLRRLALSEEFNDYESLNIAFQKLVGDHEIDFLEQFLFKQENEIGSTGNRILSNQEKGQIRNLVKKSPDIIIGILTTTSPKVASDKTHDLFSSNEWIIVHRFVRVLFPDALTAGSATFDWTVS